MYYTTLTLTNNQIDEVIIQDLKNMYRILQKPQRDEGGLLMEPETDMMDAIDKVLKYYMTPQQQKEWEDEKVV